MRYFVVHPRVILFDLNYIFSEIDISIFMSVQRSFGYLLVNAITNSLFEAHHLLDTNTVLSNWKECKKW